MLATESSIGTLRFGVFEVDLRAAELRKHGVRIKLQDQPFQILALLLKRPGELVTREELRQELWPAHTFVDFDRGLNKAMTKLRSALGDSAESPRYIETLHRRGYRFLAPLTEHFDESSHSHSAHAGDQKNYDEAADHPHEPAMASEHPWLSVRGAKSLRLAGILSMTLITCAAAIFYLRMYHPVVFGGSANQFGPRRSVAVLGFRNLSKNVGDAWLSTALSDWLITELSAGDQLRTIPAESVARMKMELSLPDVESIGADSLTRIRKNLGTDYVVAGSYAMLGGETGGQMRLDMRLQDVRTGETVAAVSEIGAESRLFDLVADAGEKLRSKLGVGAITTEEAAEVATTLPSNSEAARLYWGGLALLRVFDALAAHDLLLKAVSAEPTYALSHSALATAWSQLGYDANATSEAKKAFDLSGHLSRAERLLVEGRYREMTRDWDRAIEIYRALFEFFPDNLDYGLALSNAQVNAGKGKDALATVAALRSLPSPLSDDPRIDLANGHAAESLGDFKTVQVVTARAAEKAAAAGASLLLARARLDQSWAYENLGLFDQVDSLVREAKQLYEVAHDRKGAADAVTLGAIALEMKGDYLGARNDYEESLAIYREIGGKLNVANETDNIGDTLLALGNLTAARKNYEASLAMYREVGHPDGIPLAKNGLGDVYLALGMHQEAKKMYEESLEVCRQIGDRSKAGVALSGLGRVYSLEGDIAAARKNDSDAKALFEEIGDKSQAAEADLQLAQILLDEGKIAPAANSARTVAGSFDKTRALKDQAAAYLVLSRALLEKDDLTDASAAIDEATQAADQSHVKELILFTSVAAAQVRAASRKSSVKDSTMQLAGLVAQANEAGFVNVAMEARLALGELKMTSGDRSSGAADLDALQKDAASGGYLLIARKAETARRVLREQAQLRRSAS
jgi:DNA-binding winged helix-turn-helix (wHTH) protein/tetratricopeptide (TPR) repeat protein